MIEVKVNAGICGFNTMIRADSVDMQIVLLELITDCPNLKPMEQELKEVDGYDECFSKFGESTVYEIAKKYCRHAACPVPSAIIKGIEAACGLALPKDVDIKVNSV